MTNLIGKSLGRYHIIEKLGEGGMAIVYKAYDTRLECDVAVKLIRTDQLAPAILERALKRFEREAKAVARLTHPAIVRVTDYGEFEGSPYLVMPYLPGGTLKEYLQQHGKMNWKDAARLLIPVAEALDYAHEQKVIHRDVKPSNILLTSKSKPMLTDFGVAKIIDEEVTQDLTGTSATVETPEYMAPEQVTRKTVDHRADIYALGVVFFEMVTGRRPFEADTPMAVLFKHAGEPLPRPNLFAPDLPEDVEHILFKALAKKPEDRYQTMGEFVSTLNNIERLELQNKNTKDNFEGTSPQKTIKDHFEKETISDLPFDNQENYRQKFSLRFLRYFKLGHSRNWVSYFFIAVIIFAVILLLINGVKAAGLLQFRTTPTNTPTRKSQSTQTPLPIITSAFTATQTFTITPTNSVTVTPSITPFILITPTKYIVPQVYNPTVTPYSAVDSDNDGTPDYLDQCPLDPFKVIPGVCGCGWFEEDIDHDGHCDYKDDACPTNSLKWIDGGVCGCDSNDIDTDKDGLMDCVDPCPNDPTNNCGT